MEDLLGYKGRRVAVSGAASGMGAATASLLGQLGAVVVALDLKEPQEAPGELVALDLRERGSIEDAAARISAGPRLDALFSCAGLPGPPFADLDVLLVNFVGARHLVECLVPAMGPGSSVTCVASAGGIGWQQNLPLLAELLDLSGFEESRAWCESHEELISRHSAYALSKQLINAWTARRSFSLMRDHGIRLNCTNPGPTATPMMQYFHAANGKALVDAAQGPLGRYSTPEEQAWPLVFLGSPRASSVVGETFFVDGGFHAALLTGQLDFSAMGG